MAIKSVKPNIFFLNYDKLQSAAKKKDEQILSDAHESALAKTENNSLVKAQKALPYVMAGALSIGVGAKTPGTLSKKIVKGAQVIGFYAAMDAVLKTIYGAEKIIEKKAQEREPKKESKHPFLKSLATVGAGLAILRLSSKGLFQGVNKIIENKPQVLDDAIGKVKKGLSAIDRLKLASKVEEFKPKYHAFESKYPKLVSKVSENLFPIAIVGYGLSAIGLGVKNNKKREDAFKESVVKDVISRQIASDILK